MNVGNGDCAYIKAPGSSGLFIDTGPKTPYFDAGQSILSPFLLWEAVQKLDAIVISHPEMDHMGGTLTTMKNFMTKKLFINLFRDSQQSLKDLSSFANNNNVEMLRANASNKITVGETSVTFLHPPTNFVRKKLNDMSVVARVDYRNFSVLFT